MKILLMVLGAILILILAVVITGMLLPRRHSATRSAAFRAKPEQLYALIAGTQTWRPDVRSYEAVREGEGLDLFRETTRNGESIIYEIVVSPPYSIQRRIATTGLPYSGTWSYSLTPEGDFTTVRITEDGEVYNPIFRFVSRFILGQTRSIDAYLQAMGSATGQQVQIKD